MKVLLITPPMTQINTPYPATAYLTGFLRQQGFIVNQIDAGLRLVLQLFSNEGLSQIHKILSETDLTRTHLSVAGFMEEYDRYQTTITPTLRFLQGKDPTLAHRIARRNFLPEGPRFQILSELENVGGLPSAFGDLGTHDQAQYLASLFLDDLADVIKAGIDDRFEFSRYAEKLAASAPTFDPLLTALQSSSTLIDSMLESITCEAIEKFQPEVIGFTLPFPGNVYGAFRMAQKAKALNPKIKIVAGGGYVNTEWRSLNDTRVFQFFDYITLDDGEMPFLRLLNCLSNKGERLFRTFYVENSKVILADASGDHDIPLKETGIPTYDGLPLGDYLSLCEVLNPMHRLWTDGRWNKLTIAHGCYWKKCNFCDTTLDYIRRYEPAPSHTLLDRIEKLIEETGQTGFHFVDEAAPPHLLRKLAEGILKRNLVLSWWGNIRFEKAFDLNLTHLLAESGCIAVSGGLEVASDRLLKKMNKGVTFEQVAQVTHAFSQSGILVHAYLMFGFPTQTVQETIDSLERVRQLFFYGCIQSAFWHQFSATVHSPIGQNPEDFDITVEPSENPFANNDLVFNEIRPIDHSRYHPGLKKALYNFMHGLGLQEDVRHWFEFKVPKTTVDPKLVAKAIAAIKPKKTQPEAIPRT